MSCNKNGHRWIVTLCDKLHFHYDATIITRLKSATELEMPDQMLGIAKREYAPRHHFGFLNGAQKNENFYAWDLLHFGNEYKAGTIQSIHNLK